MSAAKRFVPRCAHPGCGAYAGFGYGCTREIGSGTWYCGLHRPSDEAAFLKNPPHPDPLPAGEREVTPKRIPGGLF